MIDVKPDGHVTVDGYGDVIREEPCRIHNLRENNMFLKSKLFNRAVRSPSLIRH